MGTVGLISYPDSGPIGSLGSLFASFAGSVHQALPVKFVDTLAKLNGTSLSSTLPAGTLAMLTADHSGLSGGAQFAMHADGKWRLIGTCTALNVSTFVSALSTYTNIKTAVGATAWDGARSSMVVFTSIGGANSVISAGKTVSGSGSTATSIAAGGSLFIPVAFPSGSFQATPSNILVTANSSRPTCAAVSRTKDGFSLQLSNWSTGSLSAGTGYTWTAWA
jgi:hypothetical protein